MIKIFTTNENKKVELTPQELKSLLDEAYWEGYHAATSSSYTYHTPNWTVPNWTVQDFTITCDGTSVDGGTSNGKSI